jgi:protein-disulfide isomerase
MLKRALLVGVTMPFWSGLSVAADEPCQPISSQKESSFVQYVRTLLGAPDNSEIRLVGTSMNDRTCYTRLQFAVPGESPRLTLFLSPDQRFLSPQVFDVSVDYKQERAEDQHRVSAEIERYISSSRAPALGPSDAPIHIVVFGDFQCPYCARALRILMRDVLPAHPGKLRVAYLQFPLPGHLWARAAAEAMACVASQNEDLFWGLHNLIYDHQSEIKPSNLQARIIEGARALFPTFNVDTFRSCLERKESASRVDEDIEFGRDLQITGTPALFINGLLVDGARNAAELTALIDAQLAGTGSTGPKRGKP